MLKTRLIQHVQPSIRLCFTRYDDAALPLLFTYHLSHDQGLQLHFHKYSHLSFPMQHSADLPDSVDWISSVDWSLQLLRHNSTLPPVETPSCTNRSFSTKSSRAPLLPVHQPKANRLTWTNNCSVLQHHLSSHQRSTALYQATTNMYKFPCFWQKPLMPPLFANQVVRSANSVPSHQR